MEYNHHSLVSRPRPAFCHLQYGKAVEDLGKCFYCNKQPPFFKSRLGEQYQSSIHLDRNWRVKYYIKQTSFPHDLGTRLISSLLNYVCMCMYHTIVSTWTALVMIAWGWWCVAAVTSVPAVELASAMDTVQDPGAPFNSGIDPSPLGSPSLSSWLAMSVVADLACSL